MQHPGHPVMGAGLLKAYKAGPFSFCGYSSCFSSNRLKSHLCSSSKITVLGALCSSSDLKYLLGTGLPGMIYSGCVTVIHLWTTSFFQNVLWNVSGGPHALMLYWTLLMCLFSVAACWCLFFLGLPDMLPTRLVIGISTILAFWLHLCSQFH